MADDKKKGIASGSVNDLVKAFEAERGMRAEGSKQQISRLEEIAEKIKDQTDTIDLQTKNDTKTSKSLRKLEMTTAAGDPLIQQLRQDYEKSSMLLENAIKTGNQQQIEIARKQVEATEKTIQSEEDKREALKKQEEANSLLTKISDGAQATTGAVGKTVGFLAGIAGIATLFFSPETFAKIVRKAIEVVSSIVSVIDDFINGDFDSAKETIKKNFGVFAGLLTTGIIVALPKLISVFKTLKNAFTTFSVFIKSEFVKNMIANLSSMMKSVGSAMMKPVKLLVDMFVKFGTFMRTTFITPLIDKLKAMMKAVGSAMMGMVTKLVNMFNVFGTFMKTTFVAPLISNLKSMMAAVGGAFMKVFSGLLKTFQVFRVFMMATFVPSMYAALVGMMGAMAPILVAMAPILLPILAIAALFAVIGVALAKIRDAMGFTSIFDVMLLGVAYLKDAFAHVVNFIGTIVNFILGLVEKFGRFLGFEIDLPKIPKMDTDNAAKKKAELQAKAEEVRLEKEQEALRKEQAASPDAVGTDLINTSTENALATPPPAQPVVVSNNQSSNVSSSSTVTSNITSGRPLRTSGLQLSFAR